MAEPCAIIYIIVAEDYPDKFLKDVIIFVGALCRGVSRQGLGAMGCLNRGKTIGDQCQCLIPAGLDKFPVVFDERGGEAVPVVHKIIAETSLDAESAVIG